jgi:soluble lytic murein transglycosylase-like protein
MSVKILIAVSVLGAISALRAGGAIAGDRPHFCGTGRWQPIIHEAAERFDLPTAWLDAVVLAESAGCNVMDGKPTTSSAGAMGLMQLMPATWQKYRDRLGLADDPFGARDNIFAGAAYLSALYRRYGSAGFLAAYQFGPERYKEYLADRRPLPGETVQYIARVHRAIERIHSRSTLVQAPNSPAVSALFFALAESPSTPNRLPVRRIESQLFVQLSNPRKAANLSLPKLSHSPSR